MESDHISAELRDWLIAVRRDLHMNPEPAYEEFRTTDRIAAILTELGLEVSRFDDITGAVGLIRGRKGDKTLALRADIDALPLDELNDAVYKSRRRGLMHACGHDAHTAIMLGVAKHLVESGLAEKLEGNVKFLFQPAEEGGAGAKKMIERGVLEEPRVDWVLAGHLLPEREVGRVGVHKGQSHASADQFRLIITGRGAHGGRPHQGRDPILAGAHCLTAFQSVVGRSIDPLDAAVITVGRFQAGTALNVIPNQAVLEGTVRAIGEGVRERLLERMAEVARGVETAFQVECELEIRGGYPPCVNDPGISELMFKATEELFGPGSAEYMRPSTGAEDFAYFAQTRPSSIVRLGCNAPGRADYHPLHSPYFDPDEGVLALGVRLFTEAVRRLVG